VKSCSEAVMGLVFRHGKSPCFSRGGFRRAGKVDRGTLVPLDVNIRRFVE
jgi:hypothetical protein